MSFIKPSETIIGGAVAQEGGKGVLIRVHNIPQLAAAQGGIATLAQRLAPGTVEDKALSELSNKLGDALKKQGVDASVTIVNPSGFEPAGGGHLLRNVGIGLGVVGVVGLGGYLIFQEKEVSYWAGMDHLKADRVRGDDGAWIATDMSPRKIPLWHHFAIAIGGLAGLTTMWVAYRNGMYSEKKRRK